MSREKGKFYLETPIGKKFSRLTVIEDANWYESPSGKSRMRQVKCVCDCGKEVIVRLPYLKNGTTKSCGCLQKDITADRNKKYNQFIIKEDYCIGYDDKGNKFLFDTNDYPKIKDFYWRTNKNGYMYSKTCTTGGSSGMLHRFIMNAKPDEFIDHINGDVRDNRKNNLRICTSSQNSQNRHTTANNKCGKVGVCYRAYKNKYEAYIYVNGHNKYLGVYDCIDEAIKARIDAELKYYGEFAESYNSQIK